MAETELRIRRESEGVGVQMVEGFVHTRIRIAAGGVCPGKSPVPHVLLAGGMPCASG